MNAAKPEWRKLDQGQGINDNERGKFSERDNKLMFTRISVVFSRRGGRVAALVQISPDCSLVLVNLFSLQKSCAS